MAHRESGGKKILLCVGLFLVASCHCAKLTKLKELDRLRGNLTLSHSWATGSEPHHGRLLIGQNSLPGAKLKGTKAIKNFLDVDSDYQADMGWGQPKQPKGEGNGLSRQKPDDAAVEQLLKMEPKVECTGDFMKLQVQDTTSTPGSLLFVDRGSRLSPLPLSKLPPSCGYAIRSTRRDLVLVAPYDGCFVAPEEDSYVLPLRWLGLPVRMSCPLMRQSSPNPPMVTCHAEGMVVKTEWTVTVANIKVNMNGTWEPLMRASPKCGFSVVEHPEGVVVSVRYAPCLEKKDGMYTIELVGDRETKISCPSLSPVPPEAARSPAKDPKQQTETQSKEVFSSNPPQSSTSAHAPEPTSVNPAHLAVPNAPGFPQFPEVPNEKPNQGPKDVYQSQLPYFPFYPNYFYPYPTNPDTKPTPIVQTTPPPVINKNDGQQSRQTVPPAKPPMNPEVSQQFIPLPSYPWPVQPEELPVEKAEQPPATQQPNGQEKQPFNPYPFFVKPPYPDSVPLAPELKPLPSIAPPIVKTTKDQRQQLFYPYPINPQPFMPETSLTEPLVTQPPPGKLKEQLSPNPVNHPSRPPMEPSASQSERQEHNPLYPLHFYPQPPSSESPQGPPENPEKLLPEQPVPPKPSVSEEPQGQLYKPFYPYSFLPQGPYQIPVLPIHQTPTPAPTGQLQQPLSTLQPEVLKPEALENLSPNKPLPAPESKGPSLPEAPQKQVYHPFYPYPFFPNLFYSQPKPENQPATKPTAVPEPPKPTPPEVLQGQVYNPFYANHFYPQPEPEYKPNEKPTAVPKPPQPPQPESPHGQEYQALYTEPENKPATKPTAVPKPPQPPQDLVYNPLYPYQFYPNAFYPQPKPDNQPATKPPQPEAPQGQVYQPIYPQATENQPAAKPPAVPKPPQPEAPHGQVYQAFYPQPEPENQPATKLPQPPQPEVSQGQVYYPYLFYPNPFHPQPETETQPATGLTAVPKPPQPEAPHGQVYQAFYPQPEPENQPATKPPQPPQPEVPQGQVYNPLYPYPFYPNPFHPQPETENQPATEPTAVSKPPRPEASQGQVYQPIDPQPEPENPKAVPQPEAPQGQVHQLYHYPFLPNNFYPLPEPENQPAEKPTAVPKPPENETPKIEAHKPSRPQTYAIPDAGTNSDKADTEKPPEGQVPHPISPSHYPQQPQQPQPVILPPATSMQQQHQQGPTPASSKNPPESVITKPSNGGIVPQGPQLDSSHMPPVLCPQFCPPGFSNCCLQIAFHQHLHHFLPAGHGNKGASPVYPGLPFLPSFAYSGFGSGFGSSPTPQKPTETTPTSTSASVLPQSLPSGNAKRPYLQPLDGNPAAIHRSNPSKPTNPEQQTYPYFVPYSPYPPQNEELQNLPQRQSPAHYILPSKTQAPGNEPVNQMVQNEPYNLKSPKQQNRLSAEDTNNPSGPKFMSFISQNVQQQHIAKQQNKPTVKELQPPNTISSDSNRPTHPKVQSELARLLVPYYMPQDAEAPPFNKLAIPNNNSTQPQPFVTGSKKYTRHEQTASTYSEPKSYVLLQHGPPGRERNSFSESLQPFRQEKPQHPKWVGIGKASPLHANVNYMPRPGDKSESLPLLFSASDGPDTVPLPQESSFSAEHLKPKFFDSFKDYRKSVTPLSSSQMFPPHVPGKVYQQWSSAADHQAKGQNQHIQNGGNWKQK